MLALAKEPFDYERNNCAHAAHAALGEYPKACVAMFGLRRTPRHLVWRRAQEIAAACKLAPADSNGPAFGVLNCSSGGQAIAARVHGRWWRRGSQGVMRVEDSEILQAWSVE